MFLDLIVAVKIEHAVVVTKDLVKDLVAVINVRVEIELGNVF